MKYNIMKKTKINDNAIEGAPGGRNGVLNYQTPYGTPFGPDTSQNPGAFVHSDLNKAVNQIGSNSNTVNPLAHADGSDYNKDLNKIFKKKETPTPDEVLTGMKYELQNMTKKDKALAKKKVLGNLKKNPKYYSELQHLNIDDKEMTKNMDINENKNLMNKKFNFAETKKILEQMAEEKTKRFWVDERIIEVMKDCQEKKDKRNAWRGNL
jgi:hypothetical protein